MSNAYSIEQQAKEKYDQFYTLSLILKRRKECID
jgi:hypothetical protein